MPDLGPQRQTPLLFQHFNWKNLSLIAGLSRWNLHFELFAETIRSPHIVIFLKKLLRNTRQAAHCVGWIGRAPEQVGEGFFLGQEGRIAIQRLPAYAPELNPVEYVWAHLKLHELPNICPKDLWSLGEMARIKLKRMRRGKPLLVACWKQSSLAF